MTEEALEAELERLADLTPEQLRAKFFELKGIPLPKFMRGTLMRRAVAHALREHVLGGLKHSAQKQLDQLVRQIVPANEKPPPRPNKKIRAGTRLIREWQGRVHEVLVVGDRYAWNGEAYRSLSEIARLITGTRWNGWVFFGVKKVGSAPKPPVKQVRTRQRTQAAQETCQEARSAG
jgi:hypothetical protein